MAAFVRLLGLADAVRAVLTGSDGVVLRAVICPVSHSFLNQIEYPRPLGWGRPLGSMHGLLVT